MFPRLAGFRDSALDLVVKWGGVTPSFTPRWVIQCLSSTASREEWESVQCPVTFSDRHRDIFKTEAQENHNRKAISLLTRAGGV